MREFRTRLRKARKRLRLKLSTFAALASVTRAMQLSYESGRREPGVRYLVRLQDAGVDVFFLLTGTQTQAGLTEDESELLAKYRALDVRSKARMLDLIDNVKWHRHAKAGAMVAENIGQQINGNVYGDVTCARPRKSSLKRK